jgi:hypothetical protein
MTRPWSWQITISENESGGEEEVGSSGPDHQGGEGDGDTNDREHESGQGKDVAEGQGTTRDTIVADFVLGNGSGVPEVT